MKILFYNIAYATGLNGSWRQYVNKMWRLVTTSPTAFKRISQTIKQAGADVVCLAEMDNGSFRNRFQCQTKALADHLQAVFFATESKYEPWSIWRFMTLIRKQHDAVISHRNGEFKAHYLKTGLQRLVSEFVVDGISIFLVHLAVLRRKVRARQLRELAEIVNRCDRPYLICGDFNLHDGLDELDEFKSLTKTQLVETPMTFPSFKPNRTIDLFLVSPELEVAEAGVMEVHDSDHLPVWVKLKGAA